MKENKSKVVEMGTKSTPKDADKEISKLSYEDLENVARQLSEQNRQMYARIQEIDTQNAFKRLDYLFRVIENKTNFPKDFSDTCVSEIIGVMTIPEFEDPVEGEPAL